MRSIPTHAPTNVAALDQRDPGAGNASHVYGVRYGDETLTVRFQHGPRNVAGSTPGIFDDDLLAIVQDRLEGFQSGSFACLENAAALIAVRDARAALAGRVAARMAQGVLGENKAHMQADTLDSPHVEHVGTRQERLRRMVEDARSSTPAPVFPVLQRVAALAPGVMRGDIVQFPGGASGLVVAQDDQIVAWVEIECWTQDELDAAQRISGSPVAAVVTHRPQPVKGA